MGEENFLFLATFYRVILVSPLIILLFIYLLSFSYTLIYFSLIVAFVYLLFFIIKDAFLKEKALQSILR